MRVPLIASPYKMKNGILVPTTAGDIAEHDKLSRYATISTGMYGWVQGQSSKCDEAGSGVFVAPGLVLAAKHVVNGMGTLDRDWNSAKHDEGDFEEPKFDIRLYQAPRWNQPIFWYAKGSIVRSPVTDIAILTVGPDPDYPMTLWAADNALPEALVPWRLEPPAVGAGVELYGWPKPEIVNDGTIHKGPVRWVEQKGIVTHVFDPMRDHVRVNFPSFRIERPVEGAFSGGPVFYNGALVGITSSSTEIDPNQSDIVGDTYIASLWPLLLQDFEYQGKKTTFGELFDEGVIECVDYADFRGKVIRKPCDCCSDLDAPGHAMRIE